MPVLNYQHLDVFSRDPLLGNGLVVVIDDAGLSTELQQQLTREMRQFETAFLRNVDVVGHTARLRIFTIDEELDFAGHPVLGAGAVLHGLTQGSGTQTWMVELGGRNITVRATRSNGWFDVSMDQGPAQFGPVVTGELAERYRLALDLDMAGVHVDLPIQMVSTGLPYLIVPVQGDGLATVKIQSSRFEALLAEAGAKFVYVLDPAVPEGRAWDNAGLVEDVATGSAAGPAAAYLIHHGVLAGATTIQINQGRFTGRPSIMEVHRAPEDGHLWVGGPVAPVAAGVLTDRLLMQAF